MDHRRSLIAGVGLAGLLFWMSRKPAGEPVAVCEEPAAQPMRHFEAPPTPLRPSPLAVREDTVAAPNEERVPGARPHPITPDHVRLQREISLFKAASDAVAANDVPEIRRIVDEHRASYADQNQDMADGYEIIADCIEHPGAASTARARRFFDEETYSMMRRPILRACLDALR